MSQARSAVWNPQAVCHPDRTHLLGLVNETVFEQQLNDASSGRFESREDPGVVHRGVFADAEDRREKVSHRVGE